MAVNTNPSSLTKLEMPINSERGIRVDIFEWVRYLCNKVKPRNK